MRRRVLCCLLLTGCILERELGHNGDPGAAGGLDEAPRYSILVEGPPHARDLIADADALYWLVCDAGPARSSVHRIAKKGGAVVELARFGKNTTQLGADETHLYLPVAGHELVRNAEILRVSKAGGAVEVIVPDVGEPAVSGIAVDGEYAYYAHRGGVARVRKSGGTPELLARGAFAFRIAVDASHLYYTEYSNETAGRVMRLPKAGGPPQELISGLRGTHAIAIDAMNVYVTSCVGLSCKQREVFAVAKEGGAPRLLATLDTGSETGDLGMTVEAGSLFLAGGVAGTVVALAVEGGGVQTLVADRPGPTSVAADEDATHVYWVDAYSGELGRIGFAPDLVY